MSSLQCDSAYVVDHKGARAIKAEQMCRLVLSSVCIGLTFDDEIVHIELSQLERVFLIGESGMIVPLLPPPPHLSRGPIEKCTAKIRRAKIDGTNA